MKKRLTITFIVLLLLTVDLVKAQQWSNGINISNMPERDMHAALAIDSSGTLHCVWTHFINSTFNRIVYSKSTDFGSSWSIPLDLSQNNDTTNFLPQIIITSKNQIFVVYTRETEYPVGVYLCTYQNGYWIQEKIAGMFYQLVKLICDHNDRVYVFLYYGDQTVYKYYDEGQWSPFFPTYEEYTFISDIAVDSENNLHFTGTKHIYFMNFGLIYGIFDADSNSWGPVHEFDIDSVEMPVIRLDQDDHPHIIYRQKFQVNLNWSHPQYYIHFDGQQWSDPMQTYPDIYQHNFFIDSQNVLHLFTVKADPSSINLVYNQISNGILTEPSLVDWGPPPFSLGLPQPILQGNTLGVAYIKPFGDFDCDVYFKKTDLPTEISRYFEIAHPDLKVYPNPVTTNLIVELNTFQPGKVMIQIFDAGGNCIKSIYDPDLDAGNHLFYWRPGDSHDAQKSGIFYLKVETNQFTKTEKIIVIQ